MRDATALPLEYGSASGASALDRLAAPATHSSTALRHYVPALDGVRGLAILVVMFCHFVWVVTEYSPPPDKISHLVVEVFKTGRYGVDLFFVLSGFLITGILYDAKQDSHYFRNFYARRTLRIFPLYYSVLFILFVVCPIFVTWNTGGEPQVVHGQRWLWFYMGNMKNSFSGPGFFQQDRLWVGHFWSLAIEEQFYLVWPMIILLLSRTKAMRLCVVMMIVAPLVRLGFLLSWPGERGLYASLYFSVCKLDTLALGAFLALAARSPNGLKSFAKASPYVFIATGTLLAPLILFKPGKEGLVGGVSEMLKISLICFFCGAMLVLAHRSNGRGVAGWFFTHPVMRFLGKYSYGIYIFHELFAPLLNWRLGVEALRRSWAGRGTWRWRCTCWLVLPSRSAWR